VRRVGERVTGEGVLQADRADDVARVRFFDFFTLVGMHA